VKAMLGFAALFLALFIGAAWASFTPFAGHIAFVIVLMICAAATFIAFILAAARAFSNSGGC